MPYVADLHIHSRFSGACSGSLTIPNLAKWAEFKGIKLLGTGDALHPLWQRELKANLGALDGDIYHYSNTKFIISAELSCIYSENGKMRRIHILVFLPTLDSAIRLSEKLTKMGAKLASDGRPILGMSSKKLCDIVFTVEPEAIVVPAHIWTPWFSLFGSNSGYDSLGECFGEFSDKIYAVETGLSSEPAMNWRIEELDNKSIISFSDLHSLPRLGREATIFKGDCTFKGLKDDLKKQGIIGSIEFFPEEGKYHYSGHRNCGVVYSPLQLNEKGEICPKCKKKLTVGVMARVEELATRSEEDLKLKKDNGVIRSEAFPNRPGFRMLIQLEEIIAESLEAQVRSHKVQDLYLKLVTSLDSELMLLTKTPLELIEMSVGEKLAEGIGRVREGKIHIEPGFDNTYGKVSIW